MLTNRENLWETIRGGKPDRYVNGFSFFVLPFGDPVNSHPNFPFAPGDPDTVDAWGIRWTWPIGTPGAFPVHGEHTVIKDIEHWRDYVKMPALEYPPEVWDAAREAYDEYDRNETFVGLFVFPGLFEMLHCLMGMEEALTAFYTNPDEIREMINFFVDWECEYLKIVARELHPDMVFHLDDWGSSNSTFLSPEMFRDFFLEPYKRLFRCYKDNGYQLIVHHSDCYAAPLVPMMIEMGIDIWQGGTEKNDIPSLIRQYGGQISFMTGIESANLDRADWTEEMVCAQVEKACRTCGTQYFIPCQTQGSDENCYPGIAPVIAREIDRMSQIMFNKQL